MIGPLSDRTRVDPRWDEPNAGVAKPAARRRRAFRSKEAVSLLLTASTHASAYRKIFATRQLRAAVELPPSGENVNPLGTDCVKSNRATGVSCCFHDSTLNTADTCAPEFP